MTNTIYDNQLLSFSNVISEIIDDILDKFVNWLSS